MKKKNKEIDLNLAIIPIVIVIIVMFFLYCVLSQKIECLQTVREEQSIQQPKATSRCDKIRDGRFIIKCADEYEFSDVYFILMFNGYDVFNEYCKYENGLYLYTSGWDVVSFSDIDYFLLSLNYFHRKYRIYKASDFIEEFKCCHTTSLETWSGCYK
jgi:hypothetical protein